MCAEVKDQFAAFQARDLSKVELTYLYVDASPFVYHHGAHAEPVLIAYGITVDGDPVLLGVDGRAGGVPRRLRWVPARPGRPRVTRAAAGDLRRRARADHALEEVFARSARQLWLVHRSRNALAKVSKGDAEEFKADFWALFDDVDADPGFSGATNSSA